MKTAFPFVAAIGAALLAACGSQDPTSPSATEPAESVTRAESALQAPTAPAQWADGQRPGVKKYRGPGSPAVTPACSSPKLSYFGGPILQSPTIVPVFWSNQVQNEIITQMPQFYADVTQSTLWPWLQEYDTVGLAGGSEQVILPGTATAGVTLTPSRCSGTAKCNVSDAQLQSEIIAQIGAGHLPAPTLDCTGNTDTIYMVHFPANVTVSGPSGAGNSCVQFCAYHNTGTYGASKIPLVYGVLMDEYTSPCATGCGGNATHLENSTDTASHELVEAVTDPDIGLDTQNVYANPAGWGDNNNNCGEIGDICDSNGAGDTITVSGRSWVVQQMWSNKQNKCTSTGTTLPVCSGTTLTGCRKCSCGDNGGACSGGTAVCETTTTNVLFGACEQCTSKSAAACTALQTCQQSATPAQDDICVAGCTPKTTCPAGDNCGTIPDGCGGNVSCGGACLTGQTCGGGAPGTPNVCGCTPKTTCPAGDNCGTIPDGCGGNVSCGGVCPSGQTCGGGAPGTPNVCGCTPLTACPAGDNCGAVSDGCGGMVSCGGACPTGQTCGGGAPGVANVCGCTPLTACPVGDNCGAVSDGCGGMLSCGGACPSGQTCGGGAPGVANVCGCTPLTACPAGDNCGSVSDGCGGMVPCGTCSGTETCGGGTPSNPNVCGCTPISACPAGDDCGSVPDTCGGTIPCGTCGANAVCSGNTCVAQTVDAGGTDSGTTGVDSGTTADAGAKDAGGHDAGALDAGTHDAGSLDSGATSVDSGAARDSGPFFDDGGNLFADSGATGDDSGALADGDVDGSADGGSVNPGQSGGCGCKTAGDGPGSTSASLGATGAFALFGLLAVRRRRRRD